jgi:ribonuclease P protein component
MVSWVPAPAGDAPPRVAYAIARRYGPAVERNRVRRRLRSVFTETARSGDLRPGVYQATLRVPARSVTFEQLKADVATCLTQLYQTAPVVS